MIGISEFREGIDFDGLLHFIASSRLRCYDSSPCGGKPVDIPCLPCSVECSCSQSPKKLSTLGRILFGFVLTILLVIVPAAIVHRGNPQMIGKMAALLGFCVAPLVGWWHVRSLKRVANQTGSSPNFGNQQPHS
jgi:hypothetical protein